MEDKQKYLDAAAIQRLTGLGKSATYGLLHAEGCPALKLGRRVIVREDLFHEWMGKAFQLQASGGK